MTGAPPWLVDIPQARVPPGAAVEIFTGEGGVPLRAALFTPPGPPKGSVVLSPGRSEPIEKYFEVVEELLGRGLVVLVHDWRGQGLSHRLTPDRLKGHCVDWRCYVADHKALVSAFEARLPRPRLAMTHSMGGCFVGLALGDEPRIDAAIMSAPMFGIALNGLPIVIAKLVAGLFCLVGLGEAFVSAKSADPLKMPFSNNILTHDRERWDRGRAQLIACPDLTVGGVTWGWMDNALKAIVQATKPQTAAAIRVPLVIVGAGEERLVLNAPSKAFADRAPHGLYVEIPGSRHEILMETPPIRAAFWRHFDALFASLKPPTA